MLFWEDASCPLSGKVISNDSDGGLLELFILIGIIDLDFTLMMVGCTFTEVLYCWLALNLKSYMMEHVGLFTIKSQMSLSNMI